MPRRGRPRHPSLLTPGEQRVLNELRQGGTNAEIAVRLGLSPETVKTHIASMLSKLDLRDRRELAALPPQEERGRRRILGVLAVPSGLSLPMRPLVWAGVGLAGAAGIVGIAILIAVMLSDGDQPPTVAPVDAPNAEASPSPSTTPPLATTPEPTADPSLDTDTEPLPTPIAGLAEPERKVALLGYIGPNTKVTGDGVTPYRVHALDWAITILDGITAMGGYAYINGAMTVPIGIALPTPALPTLNSLARGMRILNTRACPGY